MQKNVAGQKLIVYAFDATTNLPKTGDAANITAYVQIDWGTLNVLGDTSATEIDATNAKGYYLFDLTQAETNGNTLLFTAKSVTGNVVVSGVPAVVQTVPSSFVVAPGSANALLVAGSNAATTLASLTVTGATVHTGNVSMAAGLTVTQSTLDGHGVTITGNGTGKGIFSTGGSNNGWGMFLQGVGGGRGLEAVGGANADGVRFASGGSSAIGMRIEGTSIGLYCFSTLSHGAVFQSLASSGAFYGLYAQSTADAGLRAESTLAGKPGFQAVAGAGGADILGNITGNIIGTLSTLSSLLTTQMAESYNVDGVTPTLAQALFVCMQRLTEFSISGTAITVKKLDGSTQAMVLTTDSVTAPTSSTRTA